MSKSTKILYIVATVLMVLVAVLNIVVGEYYKAFLQALIAVWQVLAIQYLTRIAELRADLALALKREREYLYRAVKAEHDANVAKLREMAPMTIVTKRGDAE